MWKIQNAKFPKWKCVFRFKTILHCRHFCAKYSNYFVVRKNCREFRKSFQVKRKDWVFFIIFLSCTVRMFLSGKLFRKSVFRTTTRKTPTRLSKTITYTGFLGLLRIYENVQLLFSTKVANAWNERFESFETPR